MAKKKEIIPSIDNIGNEIDRWMVNEYEQHTRTKTWYIVAISMAFVFMLFSFLTGNFLFAVIIIIASMVILLHDNREPEKVEVVITDEGLVVGKTFIDYDEIKNFSIIFKPRKNIKNIYIEFKSFFRHRLSIPLADKDPLFVRENLLKFLPENLDRTDEPITEGLSRMFKL